MKTLVNQSKKKLNKASIFLGFCLLIIIVLIAINPAKYSAVALNGILVWAKILVPSLLPFFILTKLFAATGIIDSITNIFAKPINKIYNCPKQSAYVFFMSIITGYPVGSKLVADLYNNGIICKTDAIKTTSFCSNSGPMFILGSVAIGMFANAKMGYIILASHILGALLNGLIYRKIGGKEKQKKQINQMGNNLNFSESVITSVNSIFLIGGVVCFTFVLLEVITNNYIFISLTNLLSNIGLNANLFSAVICGIGEITKGCLMLSSVALSPTFVTCFCTFIISFGGIATFLQAMAFLKGIVPAKMFLLQKFTHAICATAICGILVLLL
ncbi:MAG: hypothetical protein E7376_05155 [Clostridiales bacterium]|nr:hypothetical protein [Clostridiales bacterium]